MNEHTPSGYSLLTYFPFGNTKSWLSYYRGQDCMKMLCKKLKEHVKRIIYYKRKEMISLTDKENESYENQKFGYICKKRFISDNKKVIDPCHFTGKHQKMLQ